MHSPELGCDDLPLVRQHDKDEMWKTADTGELVKCVAFA